MKFALVSPIIRKTAGSCAALVALTIAFPNTLAAQAVTLRPGVLVLDDWGVFTAKVSRSVAAPNTASGSMDITKGEALLQQTHNICARLGTQFGFRFHLSGTIAVARLSLTVDVYHTPLPGWNGVKIALDRVQTWVDAGQRHWTGWTFHDRTELVDGVWRFEVKDQEHVLLEQQFTVNFGCSVPVA